MRALDCSRFEDKVVDHCSEKPLESERSRPHNLRMPRSKSPVSQNPHPGGSEMAYRKGLQPTAAATVGVLCCLLWGQAGFSDLIRLKNGGEVRGQIERKPGGSLKTPVTIRTLAGTRLVIDRANIEFVTRRSLKIEEFDTRVRSTPDTVEGHWGLAEWCRQQQLRSQRTAELERVIELQPDHEAAHLALGHQLHDGKWFTRDAWMESQGYVKYKSRYVTTQELELLKKTKQELSEEREWSKKIRLWSTWLNGRDPQRSAVAQAQLVQIDSPQAVSGLRRNFWEDSNPRVRSLYVQILSQISGPAPVSALVEQSLHDPEYEIRYAALSGLDPEQASIARDLFVRALRHDSNYVVRRAGIGLQRVGDESVVLALIDAIVTRHRYRVRVPESNSISIGTDGSAATGVQALSPEIQAALRTGQYPNGVIVRRPQEPIVRTRIVQVIQDHRNEEVHAALRKLTGKSFGFDKRTWRLWWTAHKNGAES